MRLVSATVKNFRRMKHGEFAFSQDPSRPLTVVRAENGMGKTTLLLALSWALFGDHAIPKDDSGKRLINADAPVGTPERVEVSVTFEQPDSDGTFHEYQLTRWLEQTRTGPQAHEVRNGPGGATLSRRKPGVGSEFEKVDEAALAKFLPRQHMRLFFTDGENVEHFIAGSQDLRRSRQDQVHEAIRSLLPIEDVERAQAVMAGVMKKRRQAASKAAGSDVEQAELQLEEAEQAAEAATKAVDDCKGRIERMSTHKAEWESRLNEIKSNGDLTSIQARIAATDALLQKHQEEQDGALTQMRGLLRHEEMSWACIGDQLNDGLKVLADLELQGVIPGVSIEVLRDRLDLGVCVCGESLETGHEAADHRRAHIEGLLTAQLDQSPDRQDLTRLMHISRQARRRIELQETEGTGFDAVVKELLQSYADAREQIEQHQAEMRRLLEARARIDEEEINLLTTQISEVDGDLKAAHEELGSLRNDERTALAERKMREESLDEHMKNRSHDGRLEDELLITQDVDRVLQSILTTLKTATVKSVADRMSEIFLSIVGAQGEEAVFASASIDEDSFDIRVKTQTGAFLDPKHELNGASKRALTLAFILALMELSGTEAPRIIDTPLGMVAGAVKRRMVEHITRPAETEGAPSQIVLLLTRSEISGIEDLIDERAAVTQTMTCPTDSVTLAHAPQDSEIRVCGCSIRESCAICALTNDSDFGITRRNSGA